MTQLPEYVKNSKPTGYEFMKQEGGKDSLPGFRFTTPKGGKTIISFEMYINESEGCFETASALIIRILDSPTSLGVPVNWLFKTFCVLFIRGRTIEGFNMEKIESINLNKEISYQKLFEDFKSKLSVEKLSEDFKSKLSVGKLINSSGAKELLNNFTNST